MVQGLQSSTAFVALLLLQATTTTQAFPALTGQRLETKRCNKHRCFMSNSNPNEDDGGDGIWIKTVNSKEILFDETAGRFFETKKTYDENDDKAKRSPPGSVSGPIPEGVNPLMKPEGTFFQELFSGEKKKKNAPPAPKPVVTAPPPSTSSDESSGFSFGSIFKKEEGEEPIVSNVVVPPPPSQPTRSEPETTKGFSFDNFFKKSTEEEEEQVVVVPADFAPPTPPKEQGGFGANFFGDLFKPGGEKEKTAAEQVEVYYDPVTISPDFRVAGALLVVGTLLDQIPYIQLTFGPIVTLLGLLFLVQSFRIRFVFNEKNELELVNVKNFLTGETESSGENPVVGGANVWSCDTIVNYDFFPKIDSSPIGPVLVYFKETQTDEKFWNDGPGASANKEDKIKSGEAVAGQVHFFPAVCNSEQIRDEFAKRGCGKL